MKIKKFNQLNEGLRINSKILMLYGEYDLNEVLEQLKILYNEENIKIPNTFFSINIDSEIYYTIRELKDWKLDGWKKIKGYGSEWIPLKK